MKKLISDPMHAEHELVARALDRNIDDLDDQVAIVRFIAAWPLTRHTRNYKLRIWERARKLREERQVVRPPPAERRLKTQRPTP